MLRLKNHRDKLNHKKFETWYSENKEYLPHYFELMKKCLCDYDIQTTYELDYQEFCKMMFNSTNIK